MELRYPRADFEKMRFQIAAVPYRNNVYNGIPELSRYPEFNYKIPKLKSEDGPTLKISQSDLIRYVAFVYDKNSPYQQEKDLRKRKIAVMTDIGWERDQDGNWYDERHGHIMELKVQEVNRMIARYVRLENNLGYSRLVVGTELYYDNISKISENTADSTTADNKAKQELFSKMEAMQMGLEQLAYDVFSGDAAMMHVSDEVNEEEKKEIVSYPEYIANLRNEGKF